MTMAAISWRAGPLLVGASWTFSLLKLLRYLWDDFSLGLRHRLRWRLTLKTRYGWIWLGEERSSKGG